MRSKSDVLSSFLDQQIDVVEVAERYKVSDLPIEWQIRDGASASVKTALIHTWSKVKMLDSIKSRLVETGMIQFVVSRVSGQLIGLCISVDESNFWLARRPANRQDLDLALSRVGNAFPKDLVDILSVHNGLSWLGNSAVGIFPADRICVIEENESLVAFAGDFSGNSLCFEKAYSRDVVFDWDHEDQSARAIGNFHNGATEFIGQLIDDG
jgi:hypothetical protein